MRAMASVDRPLLRALAAAASLAGCSYDWTVAHDGGTGSDASMRADVEVTDGGDASTDGATSGVDSGGPVDTGTSTSDAPPSCATLTQNLLQARTAAITCNPLANMPCASSVLDECGCQVVVGGAPASTTDFQNAIAAFNSASCSTAALCTTCSMLDHVCLAIDGGASYHCF
jgi:hypothetical protein